MKRFPDPIAEQKCSWHGGQSHQHELGKWGQSKANNQKLEDQHEQDMKNVRPVLALRHGFANPTPEVELFAKQNSQANAHAKA